MLREQLNKRLMELKGEQKNAEQFIRDLDLKRRELEMTLIRVNGAIWVLEEELAKYAEMKDKP